MARTSGFLPIPLTNTRSSRDDRVMHPAATDPVADRWPSSWQGSLFGLDEPAGDPEFRGAERIELDETSWLEHCPSWLGGSDLVFAELVARLPWRQRDVVMYDRLLPEPRLTCWWASQDGTPEPLPVLGDLRKLLSDRFQRAFDSIGCNFYRGGHDSVAWHGDRVRHLEDPVIAIVSVGAPGRSCSAGREAGRPAASCSDRATSS